MQENTKNGMGSHQSARFISDTWLTPPKLIKELGEFDLDPCSPINRPWDTAKKHFTKEDDGLVQDWDEGDRVWLNPPYGKYTSQWMEKLHKHGKGTALIFARTETEMFTKWVWERADAFLFIEGRLFFYDVNGVRATANAGAPSVLVAYGRSDAAILATCAIKGKFFFNNQTRLPSRTAKQIRIFK